MNSKQFILRKLLVLTVGQIVFVAAMCGVFALLHRFDLTVLLGGVIGAVLALGNFFFMSLALERAADQAVEQDVKAGKATARGSYLLRLIVLFGLLVLFAKIGLCHPLAMVLPLAVVSPILMVTEFFRKTGDKQS